MAQASPAGSLACLAHRRLHPLCAGLGPASLIAHVKADPKFLAGLGATLLSVTALCLVVMLCRKINDLENQIRELSLRDELAGLYNRRGFYFLAEQALRTARRGGESFNICYFDLDHLKHINDTQGHDAGSELLGEMAQLMEGVFRKTDILGRIGGDEFVAACRGDQPPIPRLAASLAAAAQNANQQSDRRYMLSYSAGVAKYEAAATNRWKTWSSAPTARCTRSNEPARAAHPDRENEGEGNSALLPRSHERGQGAHPDRPIAFQDPLR